MEEIMELVGVCGGWDEKAETFKPGVNDQLKQVRFATQRAIGLPITY
jgi:hypothetical protein